MIHSKLKSPQIRRLIGGASFALASLVCCPLPVFSDVAYSSFGSGDSYDATAGYGVGNVSANNVQHAFKFTSSANGVLSSIEVAAWLNVDGGTDSMEFLLWSDSGSFPE